ncbi:VapC toxin family PIN domain ribonuclease [Sphingomonas sp. CFBP8993]|uniref:VapC toxin family PIN domain ribonuclease n=1 Tax=Sphingomonas sp. CFBP8993 TaxID=3096526 RepID=UPI002A69B3F5|nr:VapC toxin family PIN domain ribonuclease [Sphingomonas sp. CFBP8993]MDY0957117.1 VapC toxin family PIN domain ribonuclease [Sphingomonas sp. CFBP8993]
MYLLDAGVVAELRGARGGGADPGLVDWAMGVPRHELFLSAVSLLDLQEDLPPPRKGGEAGDWIADRVLPAFEGRILPVDMAVVRRSAGLGYAQTRDALLVATALVHGLTLVTRHVAAYKIGRPKLFCPWGFVPETVGEDWRQAARGGSPWFRNLFVRM